MAKNQPGKGAGKANKGRSSPPSNTRNEQGGKGPTHGRNPKVGKRDIGTRKGGGLH